MPSAQGRAAEQTAVSADDLFSEGTVTADKAFAQQADLSGTVRYVVNGIGMAKRFAGDGGPALTAHS